MNRVIKQAGILIVLAFVSLGLQAECYEQQGSGNEVVGTLLGAALGGLLGSQIGGGSGQKIAIGAGLLAGGYLGNRVGSKLDCKDRDYHYDTTQSALEYKRAGGSAAWVNPDSGNSGSVTPTKTYIAENGRPCRAFTQSISVDGELEEIEANACRQEDGTWQIQGS